jgi:hypothetical protein
MRITLSLKIIGIVIWLFLFQFGIHFPVLGQGEDGMLIFQLDGNRYMRKNFNKENELSNYQTIEVGNVNNKDGKIEAKMTIITYDKDGTLEDASQTNLVCTPESKQVLMGIFPFAGTKSKRSMVAKMDNGAILYPANWRKLKELADFNFNLDFKGGAVGFFGTKSTISIKNRKVMPLENSFGVQGDMVIEAYVIGINVSTIKYKFFEEIDIQKGIVRQKFTENNGNYFTIEIIE